MTFLYLARWMLIAVSFFTFGCNFPGADAFAAKGGKKDIHSNAPPKTPPDTTTPPETTTPPDDTAPDTTEPTATNGKKYYVTKLGRDSNSCTNNTTDACLTLQKGVSVLAPGDILNIGPGIYSDDGGRSSYNTSHRYGGTSQTGQGNIASAVLVMDRSGTLSQPMTIQSDPNNLSPAIIDCGHIYQGSATYLAGIFMNNMDYVHFKNFTIRNCMSRGIYNYDRGDNTVDVPIAENMSVGVVVDGLTIHHIGGADNDSGVGMWSTKDWVVRNNHIYDIYGWPPNRRVGSGVMSYGTVNALVEHNNIDDSPILSGGNGVFWKDHYVSDSTTRAPVFESEIRYNYIDVDGIAIMVGIQPDNEAGENYIHHNILLAGARSEANGIRIAMAGVSYSTRAPQRIEHNLIIGQNAVDTAGIMLSGTTDVQLKGNIIMKFTRGLQVQNVSPDKPVVITYADYNIWGSLSAEIAVLGRYSSVTPKVYTTLSAWQAGLTSDSAILGVNNPDRHGRQANIETVLTDYANRNFNLTLTSPARGLMADGSNAGPYQYGQEFIGINIKDK